MIKSMTVRVTRFIIITYSRLVKLYEIGKMYQYFTWFKIAELLKNLKKVSKHKLFILL